MKEHIKDFYLKSFTCPICVTSRAVFIAGTALAVAYLAEAFGLEPCRLCSYQRIPFMIAIVLGYAGLIFRKKNHVLLIILLLLAATYLSNAVLAFYHSGVERHWWVSALEGCTVDFSAQTNNLGATIMATPAIPCDVIPWADPMFGLTMANYNVLLCTAVFISLCISFMMIRRHQARSG